MTSEPIDLSLKGLCALAWASIQKPRDVAERLMAENLPASALWLSLALVVVISVLIGQATLILFSADVPLAVPLLGNPFAMGLIQGLLLVLTVYAVHFIGRAMGGQGHFEDALVLIVWLQFLMICLQLIQTVALVMLPPVGEILGIVGLVLFLWLLTNFVAATHGFQSLGAVFVMIIVSALAITFALSLVLAMLGFSTVGLENA